MVELLIRTVSQGLQAFLPIAFALTWFRRTGEPDLVAGLRLGIAAAVPATLAATYAFQRTARQSTWEAALAGVALLFTIWFVRRIRSDVSQPASDGGWRRGARLRLACAAGATLVIVRQTMEVGVALGAAIELRGQDPLVAIASGTALSLAVSAAWIALGKRLPAAALETGTRVFALLFAAQAAMYLFHESAESGFLPWSGVLHAATEPYGPDGAFGRYVSGAAFAVSAIAALVMAAKARVLSRGGEPRVSANALLSKGVVVVALLIVAGLELMSVVKGERAGRAAIRPADAPHDVARMSASPHLLFRHTAIDRYYGRLSVSPLDAREPADRASAGLTCDRVSFAAGRGLCLMTNRGVFTNYQAVLLDATLGARQTIALTGSPSRTRISPDGRVGAITVFATGSEHRYEGSAFSTKTTIVDMATGGELGDLESFATWRDGARIAAADFNFWGVTFARDGNTFYATLKTAGRTYLVRGDVGLRTLTVLKENVECPALSPDNRLIGFKKRVGPEPGPWRFYVLDVATLAERPIDAESRSIDDQLEWLDDTHVLYGAPRPGRPSSRDVWVAPIDGRGPARIFRSDAESPVVVR
jgi:hypothetical protein